MTNLIPQNETGLPFQGSPFVQQSDGLPITAANQTLLDDAKRKGARLASGLAYWISGKISMDDHTRRTIEIALRNHLTERLAAGACLCEECGSERIRVEEIIDFDGRVEATVFCCERGHRTEDYLCAEAA